MINAPYILSIYVTVTIGSVFNCLSSLLTHLGPPTFIIQEGLTIMWLRMLLITCKCENTAVKFNRSALQPTHDEQLSHFFLSLVLYEHSDTSNEML